MKRLPIDARKPTKKRSVKEWLGGLNSCAYCSQEAGSLQFRYKMTEKRGGKHKKGNGRLRCERMRTDSRGEKRKGWCVPGWERVQVDTGGLFRLLEKTEHSCLWDPAHSSPKALTNAFFISQINTHSTRPPTRTRTHSHNETETKGPSTAKQKDNNSPVRNWARSLQLGFSGLI